MKTKVKFLPILLILAFVSLLVVGCGGEKTSPSGQSTEPIKLRFANYYAAESGPGTIGQVFADDVKELTDGRVIVEYYPGGMLLGPDKMYDGVVQGIADIGLSNLGYTFGRFSQSEVLDLPLGFPNAWVSNRVAMDFYEKFQPKEFKDVHMLTMHTSPVNNIITATAQVNKPEDLKGLKIRGTGNIAKLVEALGASAVAVNTPEIYDNLSKHVIDGVMLPWETIKTFRFAEVTKNATQTWPIGQVYTFYIVMNDKKWNELPPDLQKIITDYVQGDFKEKIADMWNRIDIEGIQYARDNGYNIVDLSPEELVSWKQMSDKVVGNYVNDMVAKGYSKDEVNGWISFIRERIDYWTNEQIKAGVKSSTGPAEVLVK